ncbi:Mpo1-like protein [Undibacterium sp. TJN25]|uniref:Mpo1-like protein n=1 Tax=Undibacterium sp. TJN25 TaxID=3413056 RepID=UPI003BF2340B
MTKKYTRFAEFYPFYLSEHSNRTCRQLHFVGSSLVLSTIVLALVTGNAMWLLAAPVCGYGFAWIGHFMFEKNRPASFKQPLFSFMGDWVMYWQLLTGKISFQPA